MHRPTNAPFWLISLIWKTLSELFASGFGHHVALEQELRHPEAVDDVGRGDLELDALTRGHDQNRDLGRGAQRLDLVEVQIAAVFGVLARDDAELAAVLTLDALGPGCDGLLALRVVALDS